MSDVLSIQTIINELPIKYFAESPIYEKFCDAVQKVQKCQESIYVFSSNTEDGKLTLLKMGTVMTNGIISKILSGISPKEFTNKDWMDIADKTMEIGVLWEGDKYTLNVFRQYSKYIDFCIEVNKSRGTISDNTVIKIRELTKELDSINDLFEQGEISEPDYVDRSLWICFDAMMKFMAAYTTKVLPSEFSDLIQAVNDYSVQYARLKLYQKEQTLLKEYLAKQKVLDEELKEKYEKYLSELNLYAEQTLNLIQKAYDPNFRYELQNSVELAKYVGVKEEDILDSVGKIDDFFN